MYPDAERKVFGPKYLLYFERDLAHFLTRPDVMPVLIPDVPAGSFAEFLADLDGFVFQGGSDISPLSYGAIPIEDGRWPGDPMRDAYELRLMDAAISSRKPVFAICRGMQLLNVFFGGTLFQDIQTQKPEALLHRDAMLYDQINHEINFAAGGWMNLMFQNDPVRRVNSVHHQGIDRLGKELSVLATSVPDDIIEAIQWNESETGRVFGVQWHPEFEIHSRKPLTNTKILYDHFLSLIRKDKAYEGY